MRRNFNQIPMVVIVALLVWATESCGGDAPPEEPSTEAVPTDESEPATPEQDDSGTLPPSANTPSPGGEDPTIPGLDTPTPLPSSMDGAMDGEMLPGPDICVWAASMDTVVWGQLVDIEFLYFPAAETTTPAGGEFRLVNDLSECSSGFVSPALILHIEVVETLWGATLDRISVHLGYRQRIEMHPFPYPGEDAGIKWMPTARWDAEPLELGQFIGVPAHYVAELDAWSLMGELLFGTDGRRDVVFQKTPDQWEGAPLAPHSFDEMVATLATCEATDESRARRERIWRSFGPDSGRGPAGYYAAWCMRADDAPEIPPGYECVDDDVCEPGRCVDGQCVFDD